ncbi:manganese-binding transcriptional regulator MntR [Larsenimonas suaedae]|uniref:Transcriptional regulator MntR n=1 Tax=Larsenimonas suaedae TaxID=1851019 RepID=A0ABU1GVC7_9GAMM|nr:manganese-binding transcriptional regulator MntR [Larsenimonas suaedae]MDR5895985.1 manganese-binding transcriptional regulator MntR [Larsenimonas suaedae]
MASDKERLMTATPHHEHFERVRQDHQRELVEDYVEEIAHLHQHLGEARASDLAERFGVSPAAVSKVVTRLKRDGLVNARPYRGIFLTEQGENLALKVAKRHEVVLNTLLALGVPDAVARADSEGIEHHCSDETVEAMRQFIQRYHADLETASR